MANIIVTLLKDEDNFLIDFIVHHLAIGFDKIILFDDQSATPVNDVVSTLPVLLRDKVDVRRLSGDFYNWKEQPDPELYDELLYSKYRRSKQMYILNWAIRLLSPTDWIALTDVDEFIWLGTNYPTISHYRNSIQNCGFSAVILTMLLYGHSYNLIPPPDNNICAFLWRSANYYGHGKYFAQVGALSGVPTPHFPALHSPGLVCDRNFKLREKEYDWNRPKTPNFNEPHLKHYTVQDVFSCFRRRTRTRVSQIEPLTASSNAWTARVDLLKSTSMEIDVTLAVALIASRSNANLDIVSHTRALTNALENSAKIGRIGASLDFDYLRERMGYSPEKNDAEALFDYIHQPEPDPGMLRFTQLPEDFTSETYRSLHTDLRYMTPRQLEHHYLNHGRYENRAYLSSHKKNPA